MTKQKRAEIAAKFNGLCAYTGKPLGDDWQIDHILPVTRKYKIVSVLGEWGGLSYKHVSDGMAYPERNVIENMVPAIKIINHYKHSADLEGFRISMSNFHKRLSKLPKSTKVHHTQKRIEYMLKVADLFGITPDKPFNGKFYFETL